MFGAFRTRKVTVVEKRKDTHVVLKENVLREYISLSIK